MKCLLIDPATDGPISYEQRADEEEIKRDASSIPRLRLTLPLLAATSGPDAISTLVYDSAEDIEHGYDLAAYDLALITCTSNPRSTVQARKWALVLIDFLDFTAFARVGGRQNREKA